MTAAWCKRHLPVLLPIGLAACGYQEIVATRLAPTAADEAGVDEAVPFSGLRRLTELGDPLLDQEDPTLTGDELEMYFTAPGNRSSSPPPGEVSHLFVSKRLSPSDAWGTPVEAVELNSGTTFAPTIASDGLTIWFESNRSGGHGDFDIWTSTRTSRDVAWGPPRNVDELNTAGNEDDPGISRDQRTFFFGRFTDRNHLWVTTRSSVSSPWDPPHPVTELNVVASDGSPSHDGDPDLAANGLAVYWGSSRDVPGGNSIAHLYRASRSSFATPFSVVTALHEINSAYDDQDPWISDDEQHIVWASQREGLGFHHIYEAWRR